MTRTTGVICSSGAQIELTDDRVLWSRNKVNEVLFQKNGRKRRSDHYNFGEKHRTNNSLHETYFPVSEHKLSLQ